MTLRCILYNRAAGKTMPAVSIIVKVLKSANSLIDFGIKSDHIRQAALVHSYKTGWIKKQEQKRTGQASNSVFCSRRIIVWYRCWSRSESDNPVMWKPVAARHCAERNYKSCSRDNTRHTHWGHASPVWPATNGNQTEGWTSECIHQCSVESQESASWHSSWWEAARKPGYTLP